MTAVAPSGVVPVDSIEALLPTPDGRELDRMQREGLFRYGIIGVILNRNHELLLLEHCESDKTDGGMWGPMGETSLIHVPITGEVSVEPTANTLYRGMQEELLVDATQYQIQAPSNMPYFDTTWPVGKKYPGQIGAARCPIVVIDEALEEAILQAPASDEISDKQFMGLDNAIDFAYDAARNEPELIRPGALEWLLRASDMLPKASFIRTSPVHVEPWPAASLPTQDIIFKDIWK